MQGQNGSNSLQFTFVSCIVTEEVVSLGVSVNVFNAVSAYLKMKLFICLADWSIYIKVSIILMI